MKQELRNLQEAIRDANQALKVAQDNLTNALSSMTLDEIYQIRIDCKSDFYKLKDLLSKDKKADITYDLRCNAALYISAWNEYQSRTMNENELLKQELNLLKK